MKIGIYDRSWGELICGAHMYVGKTAQVLASRGHDVTVVYHQERILHAKIAEALGLDLSGVAFRQVTAEGSVLRKRFRPLARHLDRSSNGKDLSRPYDLFIYSSSGEVPQISHARRSILIVYFPCITYEAHHGYTAEAWRRQPAAVLALRRWYHARRWDRLFASYPLVIACSRYTQDWIRRWWRVESTVVYPPAGVGRSPTAVKQPLILSLGRFMPDKKQDVLVACFKQMCDQGLRDWRLALVGGSPRQGEAEQFVASLRDSARGYPIEILSDLPGDELGRRLGEASLFWHAKGYGEDAEAKPQAMEHFGIATVEAMAAGCVPLTYRGGGQVEIVRDCIDGLLWETTDELVERTWSLIRDGRRLEQLARSATERAAMFSERAFDDQLLEAIGPMLSS
jgi:glycosyltransferase involved in cell wall biosynthesis